MGKPPGIVFNQINYRGAGRPEGIRARPFGLLTNEPSTAASFEIVPKGACFILSNTVIGI